jgi:hypothetical protein
MRNILCVLFVCVLVSLWCWFLLNLAGLKLGPHTLVQKYFGVSHDVAFWIIMGVFGLVAAGAYQTRP